MPKPLDCQEKALYLNVNELMQTFKHPMRDKQIVKNLMISVMEDF